MMQLFRMAVDLKQNFQIIFLVALHVEGRMSVNHVEPEGGINFGYICIQ